jgi:hypothetical protein
MRKTRNLFLALAVMVAGFGASAGTAHAETLGQYHLPIGKTVCIEDHGWTLWDNVLPNIAWRLRSNYITDAVVLDSCASYPDNQVVTIAVSDSPSENYCARTERGYYLNGVAQGRTTIRVNKASVYWNQCHSTWSQRAHVMSHEMGHALGLVHCDCDSVVAAPQRFSILWFTDLDYSNLRQIYSVTRTALPVRTTVKAPVIR